jgi:hypothetical protein
LSLLRRYRILDALLPFEQNSVDRRNAERFPIEREIRYKLLRHEGGKEEGVGKSINISSAGILFTTDRHLRPGSDIEVTVSWPVLLTADLHLRLVALGRVVRSEEGTAAMEISRYEFRSVQADASSSQF